MATEQKSDILLKQREAELALIYTVQQGLLGKKDMLDIYELIGEKLRGLFDAQVTGIYTFDLDASIEHFQYLYEDGERLYPESRPLNQIRMWLIKNADMLLVNENADATIEKITGDKHVAVPGTRLPKSLVFVPLIVDKNVTGCLSLQNLDREHAFKESDVQLLNTLANSISIALENARLFNETQQRNAELAVINSVQQGLVAEMDMQGIYDLVGEKIRTLFDAQVVIIATLHREDGIENFQYFFENGERIYPSPRPYDKIRERLISTQKLILIEEDSAQVVENITGKAAVAVPGTKWPKSLLFVPLKVGYSVPGYVSLQNLDREHAFSGSDVRMLSTLANSMSVALENARLYNQTEQRATEMQTVNRISQALVSQLEFDALVKLVGELMIETFKADIVYVAIHDEKTNMIHFPYEHGDKNESRIFGDGFTERIIINNEPLLINKDVAEIRALLKTRQIGRVMSSFLGVPVQIGKKPIGVISVQSTEEENRFNENDMRLLNTIAASVSVAMQNADAYQKMRSALTDLEAAQEQLVQQEKLASLGQLTAGIAHEIKNPLNFVNNFSEVSDEMIAELIEALNKGDIEESLALSKDIGANLKKIHEHGSRANGIVQSMLMHSRGGSGKMEPTDLNALIKEYVNLAFHGMRASKEPVNVDIDLQLHERVGEVSLIAEDFSRVILNLCNNAFDAMRSKLTDDGRPETVAEVTEDGGRGTAASYHPKLTVRTRSENGSVIIKIEDNGPGIPDEIKDKILQPFFTTKKGTQGTGLGLSITNDIIKAHGGRMDVKSSPGKGTTFTIHLEKKV